MWEKKEEICLSPTTKAPTPTEKSKKKSNMTTQKRHQNVDYTTIADLLRTMSWTPLVWEQIRTRDGGAKDQTTIFSGTISVIYTL